MPEVVVAVPVKPFGGGKRRLGSTLSTAARGELSRTMARRTVEAARSAGGLPLVLAADAGVAAWAAGMGVPVLVDGPPGLDRAARRAQEWAAARGLAWVVCHSDLPLVDADDLRPALGHVAAGGSVLAPSSDGGTSLLGSRLWDVSPAYGPASFHRHLAALAARRPPVLVTASLGLALDLDTPLDLAAARAHPRGRWLEDVLGEAVSAGGAVGTLG